MQDEAVQDEAVPGESPGPVVRKFRWWHGLLIVVSLPLLALAGILLLFVLGPFWEKPGHLDFYLHKDHYERIVAQARQGRLEPCGIDNSDRCIDGMQVHVSGSPAGAFTVSILTLDLHHFGQYGYIYQDQPQSPRPDANYPDMLGIENPGNLLFYGKDILGQKGRWRTAYNNLL